MNQETKKTTAAKLIATLNRQFKAINQSCAAVSRHSEDDRQVAADLERWDRSEAQFDRTLAALKAIGATVKFDNASGEYFLGAQKFRIEFRVVSVGSVEIEATDEQIALDKAREMAECDEIDLVELSATLTNRTEAV